MRHLLLFGTLLLTPAPAAAQNTGVLATDATLKAATAGQTAAEAKGVAGYFVISFLAGVPMGFLFPIAVVTEDPGASVGAAMGAAALGVTTYKASIGSKAIDPATAELLRSESHDYQQAFLDAYQEQLTRRRVRASLWGGAIGTGMGVGALWWGLSQIGDF